MTVDTAVLTTLRVLQEKGKRLIGSVFGRNSTFFFSNWVHLVSLLRQDFQSLSNKSMSSKKVPPSLAFT